MITHRFPAALGTLLLALTACGQASGTDDPGADPAGARPTAAPIGGPGFERSLPESNGPIRVWPDQLGQNITDAQARFAATHFVGSQKLLARTSARIRAHNPGFLVLQYRLATGLSTVENITERDTWAADTVEPTAAPDPRRTDEAWYLHDPPGSNTRVVHADSYFLADVRNTGWQDGHIAEILRRMPLNAFDGVFLDTAHLRTDGFTPGDWHARFCDPEVPKLTKCWTPPMRAYYRSMVDRLHAGSRKYYAIGNFGPLVTGWDANEELTALDGGMIELFMWLGGGPLDERDWHISVGRILNLLGNDKVMIAEPVGYPAQDPAARSWILGNFLLLQGRRSYAAFYPSGTEATVAPVWLPEYEVDLGAAAAPLPGTPAGLCTQAPEARRCGGLYARAYARGHVFVNPADAPRPARLPEPAAGTQWVELSFSGGGYVSDAGQPPAGRIEQKNVAPGTISIAPRSAAIFQMIPKP
jgi:hypothetical protein